MPLSDKLSEIMGDFKKQSSMMNDILGKKGETKESSAGPTSITMHFDTVNNDISVVRDDVDVKGRPIHEWTMNTESGKIKTVEREQDGSEVRITHTDIDPTLLNLERTETSVVKKNGKTVVQDGFEEWNTIEK